MTCDFRWIVSSVAHLPAAACTTWAPGSKPPLGRGGEVGQRALRVLMNFPVVSVRLCGEPQKWILQPIWGLGGYIQVTCPLIIIPNPYMYIHMGYSPP